MRIGCFWGIRMAVALAMFDEDRESLRDYVIRLNDGVSSKLLIDVQKELIALKEMVSNVSWELPEYDTVSQNFDRGCMVGGLKIAGASNIENAKFVTEIKMLALERLIKLDSRGEFKSVDFLEKLDGLPESFQIKDLNRIVRDRIKNSAACQKSQISKCASKFGIKCIPPKEIFFNQQKVVLSEEQLAMWQFYKDREDWIDELIKSCSIKVLDETEIYGRPFSDFINRSPISIKYAVRNAFERVKDRAFVKYLANTRDECQQEIEKFEASLHEHVDLGNNEQAELVSHNFIFNELQGHSDQCCNFFWRLLDNGILKQEVMRPSDFVMLVDLYERINNQLIEFCRQRAGSRFDKWVKDCIAIGIAGFNDKQLELFNQGLESVVLSSNVKIAKSQEYLTELKTHLDDIHSLLDTLIPIGTVLKE